MRKLEDFLNSLTDMDSGWWPVLFLRPPKDKEIDNRLLLRLTCFFGPAAGLIVDLLLYLEMRTLSAAIAAAVVLFTSLAFFIVYKFTFAITWNRRARRLRMNAAPGEASSL